MKKFLKNYRHTLGLFAVCLMAFALVMLGAPLSNGILIVGLYQLSQFALSKRCGVCFEGLITPEQVKEFDSIMKTLRDQSVNWKAKETQLERLENEFKQMQRSLLARSGSGLARPRGGVSDECARSLASAVILHSAKSGKLDALITDVHMRDVLFNEARAFAGVTRAMSTTEIPLPATYGGQLVELIAEFGVARQELMIYPMTGGANKPPRWGTRPAFSFVAMAAAMDEKKPTMTFCDLTSKKVGGIVLLPREIEEQSLGLMGQFLAQYGAVEFARAEDTAAFLADGTATYESAEGICKIAADNGKLVTLDTGKTAPSDAVLVDFRNLRAEVNTAALAGGKYYMNQSWEAKLRNFNTIEDKCFDYRPDGTATLDGFPIRWVEVLQPYTTNAAAATPLAVFGKLKFWLFGTRGAPRLDTSEHAYFLNDLLATRFIEELDFDYLSGEAAAVLKTAP